LRKTAEEVGAPFEIVEIIPAGTKLGVPGSHQRVNASLAVGLARKFLEIKGHRFESNSLPESFKRPLEETKWPGRCQVVQDGPTKWMLDGAHTTESLTSCGRWAWKEGTPDVLIFNCSGGRAAETLLASLLEAGAETIGKSLEDLGAGFEEVVFCTNVTFADGGFKGGTSLSTYSSCLFLVTLPIFLLVVPPIFPLPFSPFPLLILIKMKGRC
jgi:folylpolyglutamate synthase